MKTAEDEEDALLLGAAMRLIRKLRRMRPSEVATAMGIPVRTYEHLEAGRGRVTYGRMRLFAEATDCDVVALGAAIQLKDPLIALHCADTKSFHVWLVALGELHEKLGPDLSLIETRTMIGAATKTCRELEEHVSKRDLFAERWLDERAEKLASRSRTALPPRLPRTSR